MEADNRRAIIDIPKRSDEKKKTTVWRRSCNYTEENTENSGQESSAPNESTMRKRNNEHSRECQVAHEAAAKCTAKMKRRGTQEAGEEGKSWASGEMQSGTR